MKNELIITVTGSFSELKNCIKAIEDFFNLYVASSKHEGVGRIRYSYAEPRRSRLLASPRVLRWGYVKMKKKALYCFYKIFLKINSRNEGKFCLLTS